MVSDPKRTGLGLEYFVSAGDKLWNSPDDEMIDLGRRECEALGLIRADEVIDGTVVRTDKAYPVYDSHHTAALAILRAYLKTLSNLQMLGRNGQHRYNNQDHSMLTGIYAARNIAGADYDIWDVNTEPGYHEKLGIIGSGDRAVPGRV